MEPRIDTEKPHTARIYDYYLGGKDNFAADRRTAERAHAELARGAHRGQGEPGVPGAGGAVLGGGGGDPAVPGYRDGAAVGEQCA